MNNLEYVETDDAAISNAYELYKQDYGDYPQNDFEHAQAMDEYINHCMTVGEE